MPKYLKMTATTVALIGATLMTACVEDGHHRYRDRSEVGVSVRFSEVAYGYRDGYWDHGRRWHRWEHREDADRYRSSPNNSYHDWDHTRDPDQGWHDRDDSHR